MTELKKNRERTSRFSAKKIIFVLIGVALAAVIGIALRYVFAYNGFLDKITKHEPEKKEYSVAVLNDSAIEKITSLAGKSVGFLKTDTKVTTAEQKLQETISAEAPNSAKMVVDYYDDADTLIDVLGNKITDAIVIETDRLDILKEEVASQNTSNVANTQTVATTTSTLKNTLDDLRVIYTFDIEIENTSSDVPDKKITKEPFIIYISGSDSRNGIKATARSDVNIVAVVNPENGKILLVSIPRDTYVQLHDTYGLKDKLTHAGVYGIDMSKTTIEDFLGIAIDYTLKVSFDTVVKVVDQLDGIDIVSDKAMTLGTSNGTKCEYMVGKQHVDGNCALRFARERKSYETGDRHRGENQQQVITSIIGRLSGSKDYLLKVPAILDIAADSFETTIPRDEVSAFIRMQLTSPVNWKVESIAIDGTGTYEPTYSMGANRPLYVMIPDEETIANAKIKIAEYLTDTTEDETSSNEKNE